MLIRTQGEALEVGAFVLTLASEHVFVMMFIDSVRVLGEDKFAVGVA